MAIVSSSGRHVETGLDLDSTSGTATSSRQGQDLGYRILLSWFSPARRSDDRGPTEGSVVVICHDLIRSVCSIGTATTTYLHRDARVIWALSAA